MRAFAVCRKLCGPGRVSWGCRSTFTSVAKTDLDGWIASQGKDRFIVTILGRAISANHLARVSGIIAEHHLDVERIERLSGRLSLAVHTADANACVELTVSGDASSEESMRAAFLATAHDLKIDIAFQSESIFRRNRRLFALRHGLHAD